MSRDIRKRNYLTPVLIEVVVVSRLGGMPVYRIAKALGLAWSTVKSVCLREGVA